MATTGTNRDPSKGGARVPAEFDFRTDGMTVPTQAMFDAASNATYKDDNLREDPTTEQFQAEMAALTDHEDALFVVSATMGNQLGLRSLLTQPPYSIIAHRRSHILHWEAGGVASLTGATIHPVEPRNGKYLTLEDIMDKVVLDGENVQLSPTKVISIENTLYGLVTPLEEIRKISAFAHQNGIKMHLDGARIFDAVASGAGTLPEFTREFDAVTMCFSKGLGAPMGGVLVGSKQTISQARRVRQSIGGGIHQTGMFAAMARVALKQTFGDGIDGKGSLLCQVHRNAMRITELWVRSGGKLLAPTETNMVFLDIEDAQLSISGLEKISFEHGLLIKNQRLVVHYQISEEAIQRVGRLFTAIAAHKIEEQGKE